MPNIRIERTYLTGPDFCRDVNGPPSRRSKTPQILSIQQAATRDPLLDQPQTRAPQEGQTFNPGSLRSQDRWILGILMGHGGSATDEEICSDYAKTFARRNEPAEMINGRLAYLIASGGCSKERLPDGTFVVRVEEAARKVAKKWLPK